MKWIHKLTGLFGEKPASAAISKAPPIRQETKQPLREPRSKSNEVPSSDPSHPWRNFLDQVGGKEFQDFLDACLKPQKNIQMVEAIIKKMMDSSSFERGFLFRHAIRMFHLCEVKLATKQGDPWPDLDLSRFPEHPPATPLDNQEKQTVIFLKDQLQELLSTISNFEFTLSGTEIRELIHLVRRRKSLSFLQSDKLVDLIAQSLCGNSPKKLQTEVLGYLEELHADIPEHLQTDSNPRYRLYMQLNEILLEAGILQTDKRDQLAIPSFKTIKQPYLKSMELVKYYDGLSDLRKLEENHQIYLKDFLEPDPPWQLSDQDPPKIQSLLKQFQLLAELPEDTRKKLSKFFSHCEDQLLKKSKPTDKWLAEAKDLIDGIPTTILISYYREFLEISEPDGNTDLVGTVLRGLIYITIYLPAEDVGPALTQFAEKTCFVTRKGVGIADKRSGNACLWALINRPDDAGLIYLARLLNRIKYPSIKKVINLALNEAAERAGVSRFELDELTVPDHGLHQGEVSIPIGGDEGSALLTVTGNRHIEISFRQADGKITKSVPSILKPYKDDLKTARAFKKEIEADLSTQIARLQGIWLGDRSWSLTDWQKQYLNHPLLSHLTRSLIWTAETKPGVTESFLPRENGAVSADGENFHLDEACRITLWHPIHATEGDIQSWRGRLQTYGITQPFKQAHREIYLVTDAERETRTYSNRFAGHILKQHQMMTLARQNHWMVTHRICADAPNDEPTHIVLPAHHMLAEFWTEGAGGDDPEMTESGAYLYLNTDQVRFYHLQDDASPHEGGPYGPPRGDIVELDSLPPLIFSEVMRQCDLFVGVASIAHDPNWADAGADAQHPSQWRQTVGIDYWSRVAFGELSATAEMRKSVLEQILPAMKIGDKVEISGRFLQVKGKIRSYHIHLGSGNILMDPDAQYLCIVAQSTNTKSKDLVLPFEGDKVLSEILSKAVLLAEDDKITDPVINNQIQKKR